MVPVSSRAIGLILLAVVLPAAPVFPQTGGGVRGTITDPDGQPVAAVEVVLEAERGPARRYRATTNEDGQFLMVGVQAGRYTITIQKDGFDTLTQEVAIPERRTISMDVRLPARAGPSEEELRTRERALKLSEALEAGLAAIGSNRYDEAITHLNAALEIDPGCADCHYNLGIAYLRKKDYSNAEAAFKKALDAKPDYALAYQGLADVYSAQRRSDEAIAAAAQAAKLSGGGTAGGTASAAFDQGLILWNAGRIADAKTQFQEALRLDPAHGEAHYFLGMAMLNEGSIPEAAGHLRQYLEREPNGRFAAEAKAVLEQIQPR